MNAGSDQTLDLKHYWRVIWRRKGIVLLCAVVCTAAAIIGLEFVPEEYESKVTLLIADRQQLSAELEAVMGGMRRPDSRRGIDEERMAHMVGRIRSRPFLERVIRLLQMEQDPAIRAAAQKRLEDNPAVDLDEMTIRLLVQGLQSRIRFASSGSGVFQVIVADYSPENAQVLARWVSELFVDTSIQNSLDYLRATHDFGAEQLRVYEEELRRSEEMLAGYRESSIARDLTQSIVASENLVHAEALRQQISDAVIMSRVRLQPLVAEASSHGLDPDGAAVLDAPELRSQIEGLASVLRDELTKQLASATMGDWPPTGAYNVRRLELFQQVERRVADLHPEATDEGRTAMTRCVFARVDLEANASAEEFLRTIIGDFKRRAQSEPGGQLELARLETEVEKNRRLLQSFQAQLVASDVSKAMESTKLGLQIEVLDPAQVPLSPSRPDRKKILLAALLIGPVIGLGLSLLAETLDSTLRSLDEFSQLVPEPILGTTPLLSRKIYRPGRVRRYWIPATVSVVVLLTLVFLINRDAVVGRMASNGKSVQVVTPEGGTP